MRDLVTLHGGRAWVADTPAGERGARIVVTLPAMPDAPAAHDDESSVAMPLAEAAVEEPVRG